MNELPRFFCLLVLACISPLFPFLLQNSHADCMGKYKEKVPGYLVGRVKYLNNYYKAYKVVQIATISWEESAPIIERKTKFLADFHQKLIQKLGPAYNHLTQEKMLQVLYVANQQDFLCKAGADPLNFDTIITNFPQLMAEVNQYTKSLMDDGLKEFHEKILAATNKVAGQNAEKIDLAPLLEQKINYLQYRQTMSDVMEHVKQTNDAAFASLMKPIETKVQQFQEGLHEYSSDENAKIRPGQIILQKSYDLIQEIQDEIPTLKILSSTMLDNLGGAQDMLQESKKLYGQMNSVLNQKILPTITARIQSIEKLKAGLSEQISSVYLENVKNIVPKNEQAAYTQQLQSHFKIGFTDKTAVTKHELSKLNAESTALANEVHHKALESSEAMQTLRESILSLGSLPNQSIHEISKGQETLMNFLARKDAKFEKGQHLNRKLRGILASKGIYPQEILTDDDKDDGVDCVEKHDDDSRPSWGPRHLLSRISKIFVGEDAASEEEKSAASDDDTDTVAAAPAGNKDTHCFCCTEEFDDSTTIKIETACHHSICKDCISGFIGSELGEKHLPIKCPGNCGKPLKLTAGMLALAELDEELLMQVENETLVQPLMSKLNADKFVACHKEGCGNFFAKKSKDDASDPKCEFCKLKTCLNCAKQGHDGPCDEKTMRKVREADEAMRRSGAMMDCPYCRTWAELEAGCSYVKCGKCQRAFDFVTGGPWDHASEARQRNAQRQNGGGVGFHQAEVDPHAKVVKDSAEMYNRQVRRDW